MLTDTHCRNAKPKPKLYRLTDHRGLCLEVKPSGVKAWRYRFTLEGKASMFALGEYPAVSLAEARDRCEAARQLVKQGINPAQQRQIDRIKQASDAEITFEKVAREWLQTKDWEDVTKNRRLDMLERVVFGEIGQMPIRAITPAHVLGILQHTAKRGAPTVAAEARRTMSAVFEYAVATLRADSDPVWPVRKALPANKTQHKTALTTAQIGKLLNDFDNHRCWAGTYSPHATRTTGSTRLNEMGYRPDAIEAQLAHSDQNNVRRAYNHATYFEERQVMMQDWADHLMQWRAAAHERP